MPGEYDKDFFTSHREGACRSARSIVPLVLDLVRPASVIDVGCGSGTWLSVLASHGIADYLGVDGDYIDRATLEIPADRFLAFNLEHPLRLERRFDLVVCLEVAEHLPAACADTLIESLAGLGPVTLFSAAIPWQGGTDHVNEQWPEYWVERFRSHGFHVADPIRPRIWADDEVETWYAQNTLLFVHEEYARTHAALAAAIAATDRARLAIVHPRLYVQVAEKGARDRDNALHYIAESEQLRSELEEQRKAAQSHARECAKHQRESEKHQRKVKQYMTEVASLKREARKHKRKVEHYVAEVANLKSEIRKHRQTAEFYVAESERLGNENRALILASRQSRPDAGAPNRETAEPDHEAEAPGTRDGISESQVAETCPTPFTKSS